MDNFTKHTGPGPGRNVPVDRWVVLDIDDTVSDFADHVYRTFNAHRGTSWRFDLLTDYDMHTQMGITVDQFYELLDHHQIYEDLPVRPEWLQFAHTARDLGYNVGYITARGMARAARAKTLNWLALHGFPIDGLWVVEPGTFKTLVLPEHTEIVVEDSAAHALRYAEFAVPHVCLIDQPWNLSQPMPDRVFRGTSAECCARALAALRSRSRPDITIQG